jgi:endonuclease YncB( thermonuclease family)
MVFGKVVEIEPVDVDRYGRTVALVTIFKRLVNTFSNRLAVADPAFKSVKSEVSEQGFIDLFFS